MTMLCFYMMVLRIIGLFMTISNRVGSWMTRCATIEEFFLWLVLCEEGAWVVITAIVCIARPCVAY